MTFSAQPIKGYMKIFAVLFGAVLSASALAGNIVSKADRAALHELKEVNWPKAYFTQDTTLLNTILADEFRSIDANGEWSTKPKELEFIRLNKPWYDSLVYKIKTIEMLENGTAIVAGEGTISSTGKDGKVRMSYQSTNVLIKRKGVWKAVASHVSGLKKFK